MDPQKDFFRKNSLKSITESIHEKKENEGKEKEVNRTLRLTKKLNNKASKDLTMLYMK